MWIPTREIRIHCKKMQARASTSGQQEQHAHSDSSLLYPRGRLMCPLRESKKKNITVVHVTRIESLVARMGSQGSISGFVQPSSGST